MLGVDTMRTWRAILASKKGKQSPWRKENMLHEFSRWKKKLLGAKRHFRIKVMRFSKKGSKWCGASPLWAERTEPTKTFPTESQNHCTQTVVRCDRMRFTLALHRCKIFREFTGTTQTTSRAKHPMLPFCAFFTHVFVLFYPYECTPNTTRNPILSSS